MPALGQRTPLLERLMAKVEVAESGCWEWTGTKLHGGYGMIGEGGRKGRMLLAHRAAYQELVGPIPEGLTLDHLCRNRGCVNPEHLEPVTGTENVLRGEGPTAKNARKTECPKGHPYSDENTRRTPTGRICRTCAREANRLWREANPTYMRDYYWAHKEAR